MSLVAAAVVGTATVGAYSARQASKAQQGAAGQANALQWDMYQQQREDQAPYREAGYSSLNRLQELLGTGGNAESSGYGSLMQPFTGANVASEPGYQFGLQQGRQALDRSLAAGGGTYSGAAIKAAQRYAQDYAGTKYNEAFGRDLAQKNGLYNMLAGVSGTGQTSLAQTGAAGQNTAAQMGGNLIGAGNARASSYVAQGNAIGNALNAGAYYGMR